MTENLAGRGEGLAGLRERIIAAMKRAWPKTKIASYNGVILELEKLCREIALEAAAPPSTGPRLRELIEELTPMVDFYLKREIESPSNHQEFAREASVKLDKWYELASIVPASPKPALATPSPQAPSKCSCDPETGRRDPDCKVCAATQEQHLAGSGADCFYCHNAHVMGHECTCVCHGSPRKVGEDGQPATETLIRMFLWGGHGHEGIYGDDGEMQCGECGVDYKRDSLDLCVEKARIAALQTGLAKLARPSSAPVGEQKQDKGV